MKKILFPVAIACAVALYVGDSHAVKFCKKTITCADLRDATIGWNHNTSIASGNIAYSSGSDGAWVINFSINTAYPPGHMGGISKCTAVGGGSPSATGTQCWCKLTMMSSTTSYCAIAKSSWVNAATASSASSCQSECVITCGTCAKDGASGSCTRTALLSGA